MPHGLRDGPTRRFKPLLAHVLCAAADVSGCVQSNAVFNGVELDASQGQASGDSSARPLPPVARSGSIGEALSKSIVPGLKQMHEKVRYAGAAVPPSIQAHCSGGQQPSLLRSMSLRLP